jgi:holo-[acyl-carrier protein] synthase
MIKGIGIDIIEISRIKEAVAKYGRDFLNKVFTEKELKYCRSLKKWRFPELAVRFAAKEAYAKALGRGLRGLGRSNHGVGWRDIEIKNDNLGKPLLYSKNKKVPKAHVSLSHSRDYAIASVYVEQ